MKVILLFGIYLVQLTSTQSPGTRCNTTIRLNDYGDPSVITSPGYPISYPSNTFCWWRLEARDPSKIVVMETIDSMIHYSSDCLEDYLMNFDSGNIFGAYDHKWCGNRRTWETSTGRNMMILLKSDYRYETRGFQLKAYQADSTGPCNQVFIATETEQFFDSPGYPLGYYADMQCVYEISAPEGQRVEVQFEDTDIEASSGCVNDKILVADYYYEIEMVQTSFCGTHSPKFQSAWRMMKITLSTNDVKEGKGFRVKYKTIPLDACTLTLTASEEYSSLMSPGYAHLYFSDLNCVWTLVPPASDPTRRIELSTEFMDIQGTYPQCSTDKVTVADHNGTVLGTICEDQRPTYNSTGPSLTVTFTTDTTDVKPGFRLRYRLVPETKPPISCGGNITVGSSNQTLQSPNYPVAPLENITCEWTITADSEDNHVLLSLTDMDIDLQSVCEYDSLKIYNGNSTLLLATWCGQSSGKYVQSLDSQLTLVYTTDDSNNLRGFTAQLSSSSVDLPFCDFTLPARSTPSKLSSPLSPNGYHRNALCQYLIVADSSDLQIRVDALHSNMPQHTGSCTQDYVVVYDGKTMKSPDLPSINTKNFPWCGDDLPIFISGGQYMLLVFLADNFDSIFLRNGFTLLYTQGNFTSLYRPGCGGYIYATDNVQTLTQPTTEFDVDMVCQWRISANTSGNMVRITASVNFQQPHFSTELCDKDSLAIYEGNKQDTSKAITTMCGELTQFLQSTGDVVTVVFFTNYQKSDASFSLQYSQTTEPLPCAFTFTVKWTHFATMDTQDEYQPNEECTWLFKRSYAKVQLMLSEHGHQYQEWECTQQYVNVYDGNTEAAPMIGQYCGDKAITVTGSADEILVKLVTGPSPVGKQFRIEYYAVHEPCSNTDQLDSSTTPRYLTSPNYPYSYSNEVTCTWDVVETSDPDLVLEIQVLFSDLQYSEGCTGDYVAVYNDLYQLKEEMGRFCGNETQVYVSTTNKVNIRFNTDERGVGRGFNLSYRSIPAPTTPPGESPSNSGLIGAIVGGVFGVLALIVIIVIIVVVCVVRRSRTPTPKPIGTPQIMYNTAQNTSSLQYQNQPQYPSQSHHPQYPRQNQPQPNQAYNNNAYSGTMAYVASAPAASLPYKNEYATINSPSEGKALESKPPQYDDPASRRSNPYENTGNNGRYGSESSPRYGGQGSWGEEATDDQGRKERPPPPTYDDSVSGRNDSYVQGNVFYLSKPEYI